MSKNIFKYQGIICFALITSIYLFSKWLTFKGFNGTDDLHYAMLASNMLKGNYTPFAVNDIFSGRIFLIAWQALIYFVFGINTFTTQAGTMIVTVLCCYLTIFKLARYNDFNRVLLASSLFYFNPVLGEANLGVMPDVYVMLAGIVLLILWNDILQQQERGQIIYRAIMCGLIVFAAMFFKENALVFIPFIFIISLVNGKKKFLFAGIISTGTFFLCVFISGLMYYHYTGDFFFRVHQVINSNYPNGCNYTMLPATAKVVRLTYGVWEGFILESFYPVILAAIMILLRMLFDKKFRLKQNQMAIIFVIFFLLGLYFPFSLQDYQPLCSKARHFIFLLPPGIIICVSFLEDAWKDKRLMWLFIVASAIILSVCVLNTMEKWYWMIYGFLLFYFIIQKLHVFTFFYRVRFIMLASVLWVYMPYRLFFINSSWFKNMQTVSAELKGNYYYFPDHDNMMNWQVLHGFNSAVHCFSVEKDPFKIFKPYYENPDTTSFHQGWFIVNKAYIITSAHFLDKIDSLKKDKYFSKQVCAGDICAFFIDTPEQLFYIKNYSPFIAPKNYIF